MKPIAVFFLLVVVGTIALAGTALWRFRRRIPGQGWGWERVAIATLVWVVATGLLGAPVVVHAYIVTHTFDGGLDPWTEAPILLFALPLYALIEVLLCRWAMRPDQSARSLSTSRPAA